MLVQGTGAARRTPHVLTDATQMWPFFCRLLVLKAEHFPSLLYLFFVILCSFSNLFIILHIFSLQRFPAPLSIPSSRNDSKRRFQHHKVPSARGL